MADLTAAATIADPCCAPEQQASCCEPSAKADCCGHEESCGCAASAIVRAQKARLVSSVRVELPMASSCSLDESGLRSQLARYRQAGRNAHLIERTARRLVADLDENVDAELVARTVAVEQECCPFFALTWEPGRRRLTVSVSDAEHEPALETIAFALILEASETLVALNRFRNSEPY